MIYKIRLTFQSPSSHSSCLYSPTQLTDGPRSRPEQQNPFTTLFSRQPQEVLRFGMATNQDRNFSLVSLKDDVASLSQVQIEERGLQEEVRCKAGRAWRCTVPSYHTTSLCPRPIIALLNKVQSLRCGVEVFENHMVNLHDLLLPTSLKCVHDNSN